MKYQITITRTEKNMQYEDELKKWEEDSRYNRPRDYSDRPTPNVVSNALTCELTDEQFKAIKKEVLTVFE